MKNHNIFLFILILLLGSCTKQEPRLYGEEYSNPKFLVYDNLFGSPGELKLFLYKDSVKKQGKNAVFAKHVVTRGAPERISPRENIYYCDKQFKSEKNETWQEGHFFFSGIMKFDTTAMYRMYLDICKLAGLKIKYVELNGILRSYELSYLEYKTSEGVIKMQKQVKRLGDGKVVTSHSYDSADSLYTTIYNCQKYTAEDSYGKVKIITPGSIGESMYEDACTIAGLEHA